MRSDARKREASPSEAGALTEAEIRAIAKHVPGANRAEEPYGWDKNTKALCAIVARIRDEAVQAERERIAQEFEGLAEAWGGSHHWMTTGDHVAGLAASVVRGES